jgi:hypothetical protein
MVAMFAALLARIPPIDANVQVHEPGVGANPQPLDEKTGSVAAWRHMPRAGK